MLVTDVVTRGRARAATRSPEGALRAPRLAVQGRGEAGATAWWWRSPAWWEEDGRSSQPPPRECVLCCAVRSPGCVVLSAQLPEGTRASGLCRDASPAAPGRGCHSSRGPRRGVSGWAGAARPPRWLPRPVAVRRSVRPSVRPCGGVLGKRREASGQRLRPARPRLPHNSPAFPCSSPLRAWAAAASLPPWRAAFLCGAVMLCSVSDLKLRVPG